MQWRVVGVARDRAEIFNHVARDTGMFAEEAFKGVFLVGLRVFRYREFDGPHTVPPDIAREAHLSVGTARNYLSSAMVKLNARTRHEAANRAWSEGWI